MRLIAITAADLVEVALAKIDCVPEPGAEYQIYFRDQRMPNAVLTVEIPWLDDPGE